MQNTQNILAFFEETTVQLDSQVVYIFKMLQLTHVYFVNMKTVKKSINHQIFCSIFTATKPNHSLRSVNIFNTIFLLLVIIGCHFLRRVIHHNTVILVHSSNSAIGIHNFHFVANVILFQSFNILEHYQS